MSSIDSMLVFPKFDNIKVSTKTFTVSTNINIEIDKLFHILPITPYNVVPKKRGRKKKNEQTNLNKDIPEGSIVTIKHEDNIRGVEIKPKKSKEKQKKWFRNSITIVIMLDKPINFKVCRNGTFQMTGCKTHNHAELCVKYLWDYLKNTSVWSFIRSDENFSALFIPSMRNIDFSLGFLVDREKLNDYICFEEEFHCLLETSFGYTGVNIKIPLSKDIRKMKIQKLIYENNSWRKEETTYNEYINLLPLKEQESKLKNERFNTFLIFHSGKVIMSGLTSDFMRDDYYYFINIIRNAYDHIEERLDL